MLCGVLTDDGTGHKAMSMEGRDVDLARLRLLKPKLFDEKLNPEEARAIAAHLRANVPQIRLLLTSNGEDDSSQGEVEPSMEEVERIVSSSTVLYLKRQGTDTSDGLNAEDILYRRGKLAQACTVILSGRLEIRAGKDEFRSEMGPFSVLGADALLQGDSSNGYIPDFTAVVVSDAVRCLRITRAVCLGVRLRSNILPLQKGLPLSGHMSASGSRRKLSYEKVRSFIVVDA